jgi:phosphoribosylamine--glycine ligase
VIEEFLEGEEVSFIVLSDGRNVVPLEATQDHKAVGDGDTGPNTGGMGAYCDGRILSAAESQIVDRHHHRTRRPRDRLHGISLRRPLMMTADGPKVLEFNVRLGDPETQASDASLDDDFAGTLMPPRRGA